MKLNIVIGIVFIAFSSSISVYGQTKYEEEFYKKYESNIKKEYINDVYIPASIEEVFEELERLSSPKSLEKFRNAQEEMISRKLHFGLGRWMVFNWNFESGSRLSHLLRQKGVTFPDDMAQFLIVSFHRHLNGVELEIDKRAQRYSNKRKEEMERKKNFGG